MNDKKIDKICDCFDIEEIIKYEIDYDFSGGGRILEALEVPEDIDDISESSQNIIYENLFPILVLEYLQRFGDIVSFNNYVVKCRKNILNILDTGTKYEE